MLHQSISAMPSGAIASALLANAQAALDHDLPAARECLRQLAGILDLSPADDVPTRLTVVQAPTRGGLAAWQIRRIAAYVDANLADTIAIADLAGIARLSNGHFCRAFKTSLGETAHTYVTRRRVEHAQMLMLTTSNSLSDIACACGMTDQAHLTRLFRRFVDETPLVWRRTWRQAA